MCFFEAMFRTKTKPRSDRNNLKKGFISAVLFMGWVLLAQSAHGYGVDQHLSIGSDALSLYDSNAPTQHWAGADGVRICWNHFAYMLHHEDDAPNWLQHFWNPDGGDNDGLWLNDSAYTRASNFLSNYRYMHYAQGDQAYVYRTLGRIAHLVSDMGVPAHVHNDPHPGANVGDPDWNEQYYIKNYPPPSPELNDVYNGSTLRNIMYVLAEATDDYSTEDCDGDVYSRADLFNLDLQLMYWQSAGKAGTGPLIAGVGYEGAGGHVVGIINHFFSTVRPSIIDADGNKSVSGLSDEILEVDATTYGEQLCQTGVLWFSVAPTAPDPWDDSAWSRLATTNSVYPSGELAFLLQGGVELARFDMRIWLRGRVWDSNWSDSEPVLLGWLDVDSTKPKISNVTIGE